MVCEHFSIQRSIPNLGVLDQLRFLLLLRSLTVATPLLLIRVLLDLDEVVAVPWRKAVLRTDRQGT
jgi:hypothetical protein